MPICLKCIIVIIFVSASYYFIMIYISNSPAKRISSTARIGPHNYDIISILYGSLLGDSHACFQIKD